MPLYNSGGGGINNGGGGVTSESDPTAVKLVGSTMSGELSLPQVGNLLNENLVIDSYNDTGAGTHYYHTFTPFDGKFNLATNGGGLTFPNGTTQTTAGLPLTGGTLSGKVNTTVTATTAPINIGSQPTAPTTTVAGDLWSGASINYKSWDGVQKAAANVNTTNTFTQGQAITVNSAVNAFRINQQGAGSALVVEDSVNPDGDALIVDANGNLGLGVSNNPGGIWTGSTYKLEVNGSASVSGNLQVGNGATVSGTLRVTSFLDVGTSNDLGMTVAGGIQFGDYTYLSGASLTLGGQRVESNPNTSGNFSSSVYPSEIVFKLGDSFYAVPCRVIV